MSRRFVLFGDIAGVFGSDSANTGGTLVERDSSGNVNVSQVNATTGVFTGALTLSGLWTMSATGNIPAGKAAVAVDATSGNVVATLPAVAANGGLTLFVYKIDSSGNTAGVKPGGSDNLNFAGTTKTTATRGNGFECYCDPTNGWIVWALAAV